MQPVADAPVNLLSDTQTRPDRGHARRDRGRPRWATSSAARIPTVNALQARVAELLGHEAALFLPSGTMCNAIALQLHLRPGDEVLLHRSAHPIALRGRRARGAGRRDARIRWTARAACSTPRRGARAICDPTQPLRTRGPGWSRVEQTTNLGRRAGVAPGAGARGPRRRARARAAPPTSTARG